MKKQNSKKLSKHLTYKDIFIILGLWYLMIALNLILQQISFNYPLLTNLFHFLFITFGRFLYLALSILYLTSLYPITFEELGLKITPVKKQLLNVFSILVFLLLAILLLVNIPSTYAGIKNFEPLYKIKNPENLINSLLPLLVIMPSGLIIGLSELFLLGLICTLFQETILRNKIIAIIITSLFYSCLLLSFEPSRILINLLVAIIYLLLLQKYKSVLAAAFFGMGYYAFFIFYIYSWSYLKF